MSPVARVRTGIDLYDDGWRVIQDWTAPDGKVERRVYDPPFALEADAEAKANEAARLTHDVVDARRDARRISRRGGRL
jgi:hypothetical protein